MRTGAHIWIGEGIEKAVDTAEMLGCGCFQIFLQNPRSWKRRKRADEEISAFKKSVKRSNIKPVVVHMPYILNLASPDKKIAAMSQALFEKEMIEAESLGADYYVIHPGSHRGAGIEAGMKNLAASLRPFAASSPRILLENTAGQGNTIGGRWEDFAYLFGRFGNDIGLCFDTAHAFQAGYNIKDEEKLNEMLGAISTNLAPGAILLIHANDSASPMGSGLDRHQHIGRGYLGEEAFELLVKDAYCGTLPFIIETPKSEINADRKNLEILRTIGMKYGKINKLNPSGKKAILDKKMVRPHNVTSINL
ncbi:MAG: deoxyribonuclease IV [Candidatus Omnitrophica bacterium]|nr:deoxyribonuclease IV [Candidatus Omnitrophota bacterium]